MPPDPTAPSPSGPSVFATKSRAQLIVLVCAGVIGVSCFLPWVKVQFFGSITASGIDGGDGWIFLAGAVLMAVLAWFREPRVPVLILSLLGIVGFIVERYDIGSVPDDTGFTVSIGTGLWLILGASLVAFATAVHRLTSSPVAALATAPSAGVAPLLQRYWWGLSILAALLIGTIAVGTDDHADGGEVSTFGFDGSTGDEALNIEGATDTTGKRRPVKLEVAEAGYSTYVDYDDSTAATAGAVVLNNGDDDLPGVEVVFNFLGADGRPVGTGSTTLQGIEADGTGYASVSSVTLTGEVASVDITTVVDPDSLDFWTTEFAPVADVTIREEQYGGYTITGTATNPGEDAVTSMSVECVVRRRGAIVGGANGYLDTMPAGQTIAFEVPFTQDDIAIDAAECAASSYS